MTKFVKKKESIKIYCNVLSFAIIFSLFDISRPSIFTYHELPKISLSYADDYRYISSISKLEDVTLNDINTFCIDDDSFESITALTDDKDYSGMCLERELEDSIKDLAEEYNIPYQIVLTIGEQESDGNWNNNGIISDTNDYGEFQINECNLGYIEKNLGYTKDEILYDSIKNAEACIYLLKDIIIRDDVTTLDEIFGMYNGWVNWESKPLSVSYVNSCNDIMNQYFTDYDYQEDSEKIYMLKK